MRTSAAEKIRGLPRRPTALHSDDSNLTDRAPARVRRSFTLVELGVVLLLVALMIALVAPRAGRIPRSLAVRSLIGTVESAFRDAGLRARASGRSVRLRTDPSANCLRIDQGGPSESLNASEDSASPSNSKNNTPEVRQKYPFPTNTEWHAEQGLPHDDSFDEATGGYIFHPGGEATGPDLELTLRKQTFLIAVDRLTGRPVVTDITDQ
ncbi:MAG: hypothetical protein ACOC0L_01870 [bacterium]